MDAILFVLAAVASTRFEIQHDQFVATKSQFVVSGIVVVLAIIAAFFLPARPAGIGSATAPSPFLAGAIALIAGSLFLIVPRTLGWGAVAIYLALDLIVIVTVTAMSHRSGWNGRHRLGLAGGAALAYGWHAFLQTPVDGTSGLTIRASNAVCLLIAIALIAFGAGRQMRHVG